MSQRIFSDRVFYVLKGVLNCGSDRFNSSVYPLKQDLKGYVCLYACVIFQGVNIKGSQPSSPWSISMSSYTQESSRPLSDVSMF